MSTIGNYNLLYWRAADVLARAEGIDFWDARAELADRFNENARAREMHLSDRGALEREMAMDLVRSHPELVAARVASGAVQLLFAPGPGLSCKMFSDELEPPHCDVGGFVDQIRTMSWLPRLTVVWSVLLLGAVYTGAVIGTVALWRRGEWFPLVLLLAVVGYFVAISSGADAISRMRIPFLPYLAMLFGVGCTVVSPVARRWISKFEHRGVSADPGI